MNIKKNILEIKNSEVSCSTKAEVEANENEIPSNDKKNVESDVFCKNNELLNMKNQEEEEKLDKENDDKSIIIPTQIPVMPKSNLDIKKINKGKATTDENLYVNTSNNKDDTKNIFKNTKEVNKDDFIDLKIKDTKNIVKITPKPVVQSDEDSDEIDEYESSDNDENIENTQYHDSLSCSFLSDIESEHELDNKKKENISDNNKEKNKKQDENYKQEQFYKLKKTMNELLLTHEKKKNEQNKPKNIDSNDNDNELLDKNDSIIFTNINEIKEEYDENNIKSRQKEKKENKNENIKVNVKNSQKYIKESIDKDDNDLEDIYSSYEVEDTKIKLNNSDDNNCNKEEDIKKYNLLFLDDLDQESQSLFEKLEELEQRQNSLQKLLKDQSLTLEKEEKNIDQFILNNNNNGSIITKLDDESYYNKKIDSHIQKAIEALRKISDPNNKHLLNKENYENNNEEINTKNSDEKSHEYLSTNNSLVHSGYDFNNLLNNKLNTKIYREVSTLITNNEKYPYFLLQLFRLCNKIKNENQWQKLLILLENLIDGDINSQSSNEYEDNNNNDNSLINSNDLLLNKNYNKDINNYYKAHIDNNKNHCNHYILNNEKNVSFEKMYDQLNDELDKILLKDNNEVKNINLDNKHKNKNDNENTINIEQKNKTNDNINDDISNSKEIYNFENKKKSMLQLENELKKLLQLQKEQIEYKTKIEKQLNEQKKMLEIKNLFEYKKKEHAEQLSLTKKLINQGNKDLKEDNKKEISASEEAKNFLADNNDTFNYIFDELIKSKNVLAGNENEGISPDDPIW
eukprot:jgi/Orpsp1_1/1176979/evm.model.c7180000059717.1